MVEKHTRKPNIQTKLHSTSPKAAQRKERIKEAKNKIRKKKLIKKLYKIYP